MSTTLHTYKPVQDLHAADLHVSCNLADMEADMQNISQLQM